MHNLKELFERSLENTRPASPPPGQWSGIQAQLASSYAANTVAATTTSSVAGFYTGLGGGVLVGSVLTTVLLMVVFPQYLTVYQPDELLLTETSIPRADEQITPVKTAPEEHHLVPALMTPTGSQAQRPAASGKMSSRAVLHQHSLPDFSQSFSNDFRVPIATPSAALFSSNRSENTVYTAAKVESVTPLITGYFSSADLSLTNVMDALVINPPDSVALRASGRKARWHFEPTPGGETPAARWEIGISASPWLTSSSYLDGPDEYSVSVNPADGSPFVLSSGETAILTRERALDQHFRKQLTYHQLQLEGARQFENGLRIGFGLLWENNNRSDLSLLDNLPGLLPENGYALLVDEKYGSLHTTLSAQYTFRQRKRLRYFVGVAGVGQVYSRFSAEKLLYERSTGLLHQQEILENYNRHFLPVLLIRPQVGFQYQLARQLSLGVQISSGIEGFEQVPEFGLGGRWTLR